MSKLPIIAVCIAILTGSPQPSVHVVYWEEGVRIDVRIVPDSRNRLISTAWQGRVTGNAGGSVRELQGEESPSIITTYVRSLPRGRYLVVVRLYDSKGRVINGTDSEFFK